MRFNWTTGVMEANTSFWYGEGICLTQSGNLLVGSSAATPAFFNQNLAQLGTLAGGAQIFVTQYVPEPASGASVIVVGVTLWSMRRKPSVSWSGPPRPGSRGIS